MVPLSLGTPELAVCEEDSFLVRHLPGKKIDAVPYFFYPISFSPKPMLPKTNTVPGSLNITFAKNILADFLLLGYYTRKKDLMTYYTLFSQENDMAALWKLIKRFSCASRMILIAFLVMTLRVQGDIATITERTIVNFVSGLAVVTIVLYSALYLTGSLNPGDKPIIDFKKIGAKLIKGNSKH